MGRVWVGYAYPLPMPCQNERKSGTNNYMGNYTSIRVPNPMYVHMSRRNSRKRRKNIGASFCHFCAFSGTYNKLMVNYMGIHVNAEHELPYNYPLILVAGWACFQQSKGLMGRWREMLGFAPVVFSPRDKSKLFSTRLTKTLGLRARRFLASTYKQVCLFSAYRKR